MAFSSFPKSEMVAQKSNTAEAFSKLHCHPALPQPPGVKHFLKHSPAHLRSR